MGNTPFSIVCVVNHDDEKAKGNYSGETVGTMSVVLLVIPVAFASSSAMIYRCKAHHISASLNKISICLKTPSKPQQDRFIVCDLNLMKWNHWLLLIISK
jgi:hypothetical protein